MKTLISIFVLLLFISISADARGPKGGKSISNKWSPYSLKERLPLLPFKEGDVWKMDKDQYRLTTPIIPDYCKNLEDKDVELKEECNNLSKNSILYRGNILKKDWGFTPVPEILINETKKNEKSEKTSLVVEEKPNNNNLGMTMLGIIFFSLLALGFIVFRFLGKIK